jgi:hypothetical protein
MEIFPTDKLFLVNVIFLGTTMLRFELKWLKMADGKQKKLEKKTAIDLMMIFAYIST